MPISFGRKLCTLDGRDVVILSMERKGDCPVIGLTCEKDGTERICSWELSGVCPGEPESQLMNAPVVEVLWYVVYYSKEDRLLCTWSTRLEEEYRAQMAGWADGYYVTILKEDRIEYRVTEEELAFDVYAKRPAAPRQGRRGGVGRADVQAAYMADLAGPANAPNQRQPQVAPGIWAAQPQGQAEQER